MPLQGVRAVACRCQPDVDSVDVASAACQLDGFLGHSIVFGSDTVEHVKSVGRRKRQQSDFFDSRGAGRTKARNEGKLASVLWPVPILLQKLLVELLGSCVKWCMLEKSAMAGGQVTSQTYRRNRFSSGCFSAFLGLADDLAAGLTLSAPRFRLRPGGWLCSSILLWLAVGLLR